MYPTGRERAAVWQIKHFPGVDWPPFVHLRVQCMDEGGQKWTVTVDADLPSAS